MTFGIMAFVRMAFGRMPFCRIFVQWHLVEYLVANDIW